MINTERACTVPGWMTLNELTWLAEQAGLSTVVVEIGCWKGRSTRALADHVRHRVYAIDHWNGSDATHLMEIENRGPDSVFNDFVRNLRDRIELGVVVPVRTNVEDGIRYVKSVEPRAVDFVFIDAGHSYEEVLADIVNVRRLTPAATISGHDYNNPEFPGVRRAVDELFSDAVRRGPDSIWYVPT